jgi:5'-nucleotidase
MASPTPYNKDCYWMVGEFINDEPKATDTDEWALTNGFISIQPVQTDMTDYTAIKKLNFDN